jgi:H+-translocating NAD(P) transhydrogenase subunit alpha
VHYPALLVDIAIFVLSLWVGFEVISKVPATLHTPLMSAANSIHGIVLAGAMLIAVTANNAVGYVIAFVAAAFAAMNVVGGYMVTGRMLKMFRKRPTVPAVPAGAAPGIAAANGSGQQAQANQDGQRQGSKERSA